MLLAVENQEKYKEARKYKDHLHHGFWVSEYQQENDKIESEADTDDDYEFNGYTINEIIYK